jgi:hypothetical protein
MKTDAPSLVRPLGVSWWIWLLGLAVMMALVAAIKKATQNDGTVDRASASISTAAGPVTQDADSAKLRKIISVCAHTLPELRPGLMLEIIGEYQVKDARGRLENTLLPGRALILDRELLKREEELKTRKSANQAIIKKAMQAFAEGDSIVRSMDLNEGLEAEYLAWQVHCQQGIDILTAWQRDLRDARHQMDLSIIRGVPFAEAARPYNELMARKFPGLMDAPRF